MLDLSVLQIADAPVQPPEVPAVNDQGLQLTQRKRALEPPPAHVEGEPGTSLSDRFQMSNRQFAQPSNHNVKPLEPHSPPEPN